MREIAKSTLSLSWAISLFGFSQVTKLLSTSDSREGAQQASTETFDAATRALGKHFDDMTGSLFQVADELQREIVDLIMDGLTEDGGSGRMVSLPMDMAQQVIASLGAIP